MAEGPVVATAVRDLILDHVFGSAAQAARRAA
jgi:hypothetical protein